MRMCNCSNSRDKWRHFDKGSKLCMDPRDFRSLLPCDLSHKDSCIEQPNSGMSRCFDKETTSIRQYLPNSSDLVTNKWNKLLIVTILCNISFHFISVNFISVQFSSVQPGLSSARAQLSSARLGPARPGPARPGPARFGSVQFSQSNSIQCN